MSHPSFEQERESKVQSIKHVWHDLASFCGMARCAQGVLSDAAAIAAVPEKGEALRSYAERLQPAIEIVQGVLADFQTEFSVPTSRKVP